jgi:hypothetical protein
VLLIVAEERTDDVVRRLRHFGMEENDPIYVWTDGVEDTEKGRLELQAYIEEKSLSLVIIDTFASYLMIADETNNSAVTVRLKPYADMAHAANTVMLFVHHERKSRDEGDDSTRAIRGGGAILGLADLAFQLQREPGSATRRRLKIVGRFSEIPPTLTLDYQNDAYVSQGTPEEAGRASQREKVLNVLPSEGLGLTTKEVTTKTQLKEKAARTALEDAYGLGAVMRSGAGKRSDPFRYLRVSGAIEVPITDDAREFAEV